MKPARLLAVCANVPAGIVLYLLIADPIRPLEMIFALLAASVGLVVIATWLQGRERK